MGDSAALLERAATGGVLRRIMQFPLGAAS
jgi:hypothetical protein